MTVHVFPNSRRGISSVVGALIFTVLMIAGFSAMSLALDTQTDIVNTQRVMSDTELKKQQEQFGIAVSTDENNLLNVSVDNMGQNPVEISRVWITNKTLSTQPAKYYSINSNDAFIPTGFTTNVFSSQPLYMIPDTYDVKVISALGTMKVAEFTVGSSASGNLRAELITDPPDVIIGQNVTVAMVVTNAGSSTIENVTMSSITVNPPGTVIASSSTIPIKADLTPGESVLFSKDYTITGSSGDNVSFSSHASGTDTENSNVVTSNTVSDATTLRLPTDGGTGTIDPDILNEDLLARPKLFLIIPSAQGDSDDKALWGVNIANPVNAPMKVSKLSITAFAPGANNNDKVFEAVCVADTIFPTGVSKWTCPSENVIMWQDYVDPIVIPPNSTKPFLVKVKPGAIAGTNVLQSIVVQASVFTTVGSFGKSGYQTVMFDGADEIIGSVYLSNVVDSRNNIDMQSDRVDIVPGSTQTFNIVLADLDTKDATRIKSGAQLIINVPKGWTDVQLVSFPGFVNTPSVTTFGDGSTQIVGITSSTVGTTINPSDTITFTAKAPVIPNDQMYVMYVLAQGQTVNNFTIGPLAEIVLQVNAS